MGRSSVKDIDKGFRSIIADIREFAKSDVYIGINEGNFPDRLDENGDVAEASMAMIGHVHEFGSDDGIIPPRPWLRSSIDAARAKISTAIGDAYSDLIFQKRSVGVVLNRLGLLGVNIVRRHMRVVGPAIWLPLAPATVEAKGSDIPLADTGQMFGSITYVIRTNNTVVDKSAPAGSKSAASGVKKSARKALTVRKKRAKTRRLAVKSRRSEAIKQIVSERRERSKVRKDKKRTRAAERKRDVRDRKKARSAAKREKKAGILSNRRQALRDRKVATRARKSARAKERRVALKFRKKDRSVLKAFRSKEANKSFRAKVKGKKNSKALLDNRKAKQKASRVSANFKVVLRQSNRAMKNADKLLRGRK